MIDVVVIIPCYREQLERVARTVDSARAVRNVTRVIVIDDGCAAAELDTLDCEVVHLDHNRGCSGALNAGMAQLSKDDIACRLDVGDVFYAEPKARQIDVVLSGQHPCSSSPHFDPVAGSVWTPPDRWRRHIFSDSVFTGCTNVYRRWVCDEVGGHDESLRYCGDWDFSMKVEFYVGWHMHAEPTCDAGMYPDGFSARAQQSPITAKRRIDDRSRVFERGRAFSHPDAHAHLWNKDWCAKRGIEPLRRRR